MRPGWIAAAEGVAERARSLSTELAELARDVRDYREALSADPDRLQAIRERLSALKALQRKYGATEAEVLAFLEASPLLGHARHAPTNGSRSSPRRSDRLQVEPRERAASVTRGRTDAAPPLAAALERELQQLGMPGASVGVELQPSPELGPRGGRARRAPIVAVSRAEARRPRQDGVGGELSRTMLACRSVMADLDDVPTLVFDEVDAGIGGEAGLAVGRRLARLAGGPPGAGGDAPSPDRLLRRSAHPGREGSGTASVRVLSDDERVHELSRMLAGLTGSDGAITHAEELLATASASRGDATG